MALPINIDELIHAQVIESERIEFKRGWNKEAILHTICAFANDFHNWVGGYIILGIDEVNGVPILPPHGLEIAQIDKIQKELLELCNSGISPVYTPVVEPVIYQEKHILIIWVPGGQHRPYKAKKSLAAEHREYLPYIRKLSNSVIARNEDEHELYSLASKTPFDDCMNRKAKLTDIKLSLIQAFLADIGSELLAESADAEFSKLCQSLQIIDGVTEDSYPRNVGLLFFNDKPQQFFPYCQIDVVQFMAITRDGDKLQEKIFRGPIQQQIRDVLSRRAMKKNGSPEPIFDTNDERDYFLTILRIHPDGVQDGVQDAYKLSDLAIKILKATSGQALTKQVILQNIGQAKITKSLRAAFENLLSLQFIAYTIVDKPTSKNQKYVITSKGKTYLANKTLS